VTKIYNTRNVCP